MEKSSFYDYPLGKLCEKMSVLGKEKFRGKQLFKWVYEKNVTDPGEMLNLSKDCRQKISQWFDFSLPKIAEHKISQDGTQKFLFSVGENMTVEAVIIPNDDRMTLCLSSEVGCNMACKFCFTGKQKLKKRLTTAQIVGQYLQVQKTISPLKVSNIVFMGMGEPLDNCEAVFDAVDILKSDLGINLSRKKITISTSGLVPEMPLVTASGVRLAVSLNAPNDDIRNQIMPINRKYNLSQLLQACLDHTEKAKDRVTFEYVLLKDVTDQLDHAKEVYQLIKNIPCKLNLIPFNEHPGSGYERPPRNRVFNFQRYMLDKGIHVTIRRTMGRDIFAACGQLTSIYQGRPDQQNVMTGILG